MKRSTSFDWDAHFRRASLPDADFGTILGQHTAHELDDLIKAKNVEIQDLLDAYNKVADSDSGIPNEPNWLLWVQDWGTFLGDWAKALQSAQDTIKTAQNRLLVPLGWDYANAESDYQNVLNTLDPKRQDYSRLQDLFDRWKKLPSNPQANYIARPVPQPTAPDADLGAYKASDDAAKGIQKTGQAVLDGVKKAAFAIPWEVWGILAAAGLIVLFPVIAPIAVPAASAKLLSR